MNLNSKLSHKLSQVSSPVLNCCVIQFNWRPVLNLIIERLRPALEASLSLETRLEIGLRLETETNLRHATSLGLATQVGTNLKL